MIKSQDSGLSRTCCLVAHDCGDDVTSGKKDISIYLKTRLFGILLKAEKKINLSYSSLKIVKGNLKRTRVLNIPGELI